MKRITFITLALIALVSVTAMSPVKDTKVKPKIQRVVCFKFKGGISAEAKQRHMTDFAAFVKMVPQVLSYRAGKSVKGESKTDPAYDVMHYMTFAKEADILVYDAHASHKKFIEDNKASWETVIAVNSTIEKD
ncbi:MAG: Dabb family protein [Chryseolinea sp.]